MTTPCVRSINCKLLVGTGGIPVDEFLAADPERLFR